MESEENEKRKFSEFKREIKNERIFTEKIKDMYYTAYDDSFQDILILSKKDFLTNISENINSLLTDMFSEECFSEKNLIKILNNCEKEIEEEYKNNYDILNKYYKTFERENRRGKINENLFLTNFIKHCAETDDIPYHNCQNTLSRFYQIEENGEIKYIICKDCQKVYLNDMILCHCQHCNEDYYSSTLGKNEDKNLLLATWKKYHCEKVINEKMKCVKCHCNLYLNLKTKMLVCLNFKCNFTSKPESILWTCNNCKSDFRSDAIVFNPRENENIKKIIKQTLFIKRKAHPNKLPCCQLNIYFTNFYHKSNCRGTLYFGELNNNIIVVCERCKAFNFYDRFIWTCPKCGTRFRDKKEIKKEEKEKVNNNEFRRKSLEVLASPIRKRNNRNEDNDNHNNYSNRIHTKTNLYHTINDDNDDNENNSLIRLNRTQLDFYESKINKSVNEENDIDKKYREERERRKKERLERIEREKKEKEEKEKREREEREKEREERRERERKEKEEKKEEDLKIYERINIKKKTNSNNSKAENSTLDTEDNSHKKTTKKSSNINLKNLQKQIDKILNESKIPKFDINDYSLYKQIGEGSYGVIYHSYNNHDKKNMH